MRVGLVCLFVVFSGMDAAAQKAQPPLDAFSQPVNRAMERADGTVFEGGFSTHGSEGVPAALSLSFRHYVHRPTKAARQHFSKAMKAADSSKEDEAVLHLTEAVRADPEYFEAYAQLGLIYLLKAMYEDALLHLERALAIDASSQTVQGWAACALLGLGRYPEAEAAGKRALQLGRSLPALEELTRLARGASLTASRIRR